MDLNETTLKERLDTAVSDVSPDVTTLVGQGQELGRSMRRRRRMQTAGSALAVSVLVIGAVAYTGGAGLFDRKSNGPTDPSPTGVQQLVEATPRGAVAAVLAHLDGGEVVATGGTRQESQDGEQIDAHIGYVLADGVKVELQVVATDKVSQWNEGEDCESAAVPHVIFCDDAALADGSPAISYLVKGEGSQEGGSGNASYAAISAAKRGDQLVVILETIYLDATKALSADNLPISFDVLREISQDPAVGLLTTAEFISQGDQLENFKDNPNADSGSGSSSGDSSFEVSPEELASPSTPTGN